jgi:hypothetical protein
MKIIGVQSRVSPFLVTVVLLLQLSPALATGEPDAQQAAIQGSRVPGIQVPSTDTTRDRRRGPVEVTFTKWRTAQIPPPPAVTLRSLFAGFVEGDLGAGDFVAEVLDRKTSTPCALPPCTPATITGSINALDAVYEVQADQHSFTALIQGGTNGVTGVGHLNGVILAGWRTGAKVHVTFQTVSTCTDRDGLTHGPCFQGVIRVARAPQE